MHARGGLITHDMHSYFGDLGTVCKKGEAVPTIGGLITHDMHSYFGDLGTVCKKGEAVPTIGC